MSDTPLTDAQLVRVYGKTGEVCAATPSSGHPTYVPADLARQQELEIRALRNALFQAQEAAKALLAKGEMLAAVVQGAKEEFVRVPYGASHEDVAAINDWHKMAAEALAKWENKA